MKGGEVGGGGEGLSIPRDCSMDPGRQPLRKPL